MASEIDKLFERAHTIEREISELANTNASGADFAPLLQDYREICATIIFQNFEYAHTKGIEGRLWNLHLKVNTIFRKHLAHYRKNGRDLVVERRKLEKAYLQFIKLSQRFYRQHIQNLDLQFNGIPELRRVAQKWGDTTKASPRKRIPSNLKAQVLLSCHQTLIQLGDLSRYRETETVEKDRNWGPAIGYYNLAAEIYPSSGYAHNQLAVVAREDGNHFRSVYHLYRSLASKEPHPHAKKNLELELKKIVSAWSKGELINNHKTSDGSLAGRALIAWFIRLHSKCYKGQEFSQHDELENEVLSHLAIELKERPLDGTLLKIILINLAAEYFATIRMQEPEPPENITRTYFYYLRLNVKTFFTLLQLLQPELERITEGHDVTLNGDRASQLSDKITAVARRILPGLRLYSAWFFRYWHVLNANVADTLTQVEVQELWKAYAETLTLLASTFPADKLPTDNYMLEEDADTFGFQPLTSKDTMKTWYDVSGDLKPKATDLERSHPNIEMLMRVRDLLIDGLHLTQTEEAPLDLSDMRFIYREAGIPSELLASPSNRPDGSPSMPSEPLDLPMFPPQAPTADDQKSQSVAAPSESTSTALAKDSAMNRMVDDLVGFDDGLDPLPEEDENIPPTPPEQTFEDTTKVGDTSYGLGPLTASDFVNLVQNYPRPGASPSTAMFPVQVQATPMNRVGSTSSFRAPPNLPSVPDGQYGGNIWNPSYNGTGSPQIGETSIVRETPIGAQRGSRLSTHMRGDSSNSVRSSDFQLSTPVQQSTAGGFSNRASWGNPNSPAVYGSVYGNNGRPVNTFDPDLASPLLFSTKPGSSPWSSNLPRGTIPPSFENRTPPNGQGG